MSKIKDMPEEMQPREKAVVNGLESLTDAELMAILFRTGIKGKNVLDLCNEILASCDGHLSRLAQMSVDEITASFSGIGKAKALTLLAGLHLGHRATADALSMSDPAMTNSETVYNYARSRMFGLRHEEFHIMLLKQNLKLLRMVRIGRGGLTETSVDIRLIAREALLSSSPAIVLIHNHPSGNNTPSPQDVSLTERIAKGLKLLNIRVLDHIIVCDNAFYSFSDNGRMPL